ncbi:MAG: N-acetylmuramoyl-L-alanine amidase [Clostridia bacterium]|nr:N-acetylmuramoyl-L-alanine amidase [Clostridia bacterium]
MKIKFICLLVLISFLLSGCIKQSAPTAKTEATAETTTQKSTATTRLIPSTTERATVKKWEKEIVSPVAEKNYLNFENSSREREYDPEIVMVHFISAVVLSENDPYNEGLIRGIFEQDDIGINYIIDREGNVECYLPENRAAWHAGSGTYMNNEKYTNEMNKYSIGIEMMAIGSKADMAQYMTGAEYDALNDEFYGFTDAQYKSLKTLLADICGRYSIPMDRKHIIGHEEYSENKTDPGELFEWNRLGLE